MPSKTETTRVTQLIKLEKVLSREGLTLDKVRSLLIPADPWEAACGLWKNRKINALKEQRRLRREWDRV